MAKSKTAVNRENIEKDAVTRKVDYSGFKDETVSVGTRLTNREKTALLKHFEDRGLKLAQGLRMIISEYMNRERIR